MTDDDDTFADAADILRSRGHRVEPFGDDLAEWIVGQVLVFEDRELLDFAGRIGMRAGPERVQ